VARSLAGGDGALLFHRSEAKSILAQLQQDENHYVVTAALEDQTNYLSKENFSTSTSV
jgi:hypothetical protein